MAGGIGPRRRAREYALQVLFSIDLNPGISVPQALAHFWRDFVSELRQELRHDDGDGGDADDVVAFTEQLVSGTAENLAEIDGIVQRASKNWRLERMARVDRNVLRLATYELRFAPEVPA